MNGTIPEAFTEIISKMSDSDLATLGLKRSDPNAIEEKGELNFLEVPSKRISDLELYSIGLAYLTSEQNPPTAQSTLSERALEILVTRILHNAGVPPHIKGYNFVRSAILMCVKDPTIIDSVTKKLYPSVANMYQTSTSKVERAIRHAIEVAYGRGNLEFFSDYFGYTIDSSRGKPTNSEFIAMIADKIRLQIIA